MIIYNLWKNCDNNCEFCSALNERTMKEDKVKNVEQIIKLLDLEEAKKLKTIVLMGGEFFSIQLNDNNVKNKFYELFNKIINIKNEYNNLNNIIVLTNLIYKRELHLNEFLKYINEKGIKENIIFGTSYDLKGRFHNSNSLKLFDENFMYLKNNGYRMHIEIILTKILMESILNNKFNFKKFCKKYTDNVDFIAPHCGCSFKGEGNEIIYPNNTETFINGDYFFPTRELFFKFIEKFLLKDKSYDIDRFLNRKMHGDKIYYFINNKLTETVRTNNLKALPDDFNNNYIDNKDNTMNNDILIFNEAIYGRK